MMMSHCGRDVLVFAENMIFCVCNASCILLCILVFSAFLDYNCSLGTIKYKINYKLSVFITSGIS